jgi:hypothetical protein
MQKMSESNKTETSGEFLMIVRIKYGGLKEIAIFSNFDRLNSSQ